jgi:hypothetical protein
VPASSVAAVRSVAAIPAVYSSRFTLTATGYLPAQARAVKGAGG